MVPAGFVSPSPLGGAVPNLPGYVQNVTTAKARPQTFSKDSGGVIREKVDYTKPQNDEYLQNVRLVPIGRSDERLGQRWSDWRAPDLLIDFRHVYRVARPMTTNQAYVGIVYTFPLLLHRWCGGPRLITACRPPSVRTCTARKLREPPVELLVQALARIQLQWKWHPVGLVEQQRDTARAQR